MRKQYNILFRLDGGRKVGLGHLSRNIALANVFIESDMCSHFIIKTESSDILESFIHQHASRQITYDFISDDISDTDDLDFIISKYKTGYEFLVLDHYSINDHYQKVLLKHKIHWLQFDSHAQMNFFGDFVLHGSPGALSDVYQPLKQNSELKFLLGSDFVVVNNAFRVARDRVKIRKKVKNILVCFGGSDNSRLIKKVASALEPYTKNNFSVKILTNNTNNEKLLAKYSGINFQSSSNDIANEMLMADLGIIAPGTMSYEAACLGLPVLLVTIADNQTINAQGWVAKKAAIHLGFANGLTEEDIIEGLNAFSRNPELLTRMSRNAFNTVDGDGAKRVKDLIISKIEELK
jgi:UDP-2,4-diacetamido-2,4,6-trideoxy-beta-L-altropyranose hydrolase